MLLKKDEEPVYKVEYGISNDKNVQFWPQFV